MLSEASWDSFWLQPVRWQVGTCGLRVVWEMGRETLSLLKQLEPHLREAEPALDCLQCSHLKSGGGGRASDLTTLPLLLAVELRCHPWGHPWPALCPSGTWG